MSGIDQLRNPSRIARVVDEFNLGFHCDHVLGYPLGVVNFCAREFLKEKFVDLRQAILRADGYDIADARMILGPQGR